ncbi:MAG: metallophosphoesterase family protein [Candidatus Anammoxibacter sp.]
MELKQNIMSFRRFYIVWLCGLIVLLALLSVIVFEAYTLLAHRDVRNEDLPPLFGNFQRVRDVLHENNVEKDFSFAVVGDSQSVGTFERIADKLKDEPLSFIVFLGDFVKKGNEGEHLYFKAEASEEFAFPFPAFFLVGNHDVDPIKFPVSRFEEVYGPSNFSFEYGGCFFVFLRILNKPHKNDESIEFLRNKLEKMSHDYRKTFVFMHIPPRISNDFSARAIEGSTELVALFDKYKVDYVIAADYHGYARVIKNKTSYIITGGGGGHLEKDKFSRFHHAVVLYVGDDYVSEHILYVDGYHDYQDRIERFAIACFYPWMTENQIFLLAINMAVFCVITAISYFMLFKVIRGHYI